MMSDKIPSVGARPPIPLAACVECKAEAVYPHPTDYTISVKHDGTDYAIHLPDLALPTCRNCGDQLFTADADDRVIEAMRALAGLLTPQEIAQRRGRLDVTQEQLGETLGVTKAWRPGCKAGKPES